MDEKEILSSLGKWFSERYKWLQTAANWLYRDSELTEEQISALAEMCRSEAEGKELKSAKSFVATTLFDSSEDTLRLCSISNIKGVNALSPRNPLLFKEDDITIVYGSNGSGKTGYVRLLKHVCDARNKGTLYSNIYKNSDDVQTAYVDYKINDRNERYKWSGQGTCDDLRNVDIYDTTFGKVFVDNEDVLRYEPPLLSFFSSLIDVCGKVETILDNESKKHQPKKPNIPIVLKLTPEGAWYGAISSKTNREDVDKYCSFSEADENDEINLQKRLAEQAPSEKAKQLRRRKQYVDDLIQEANNCLEKLSESSIQLIIEKKEAAVSKKSAARAAATKVFSDSKLEGIGSNEWKELWEAARKYSTLVAYTGIEYPNVSDGARCVLCHQEIDWETSTRLLAFEEFVKGETQKEAKKAEVEYQEALQNIGDIPSNENLKIRIDATGLQKDALEESIVDFFANLQEKKEQLTRDDYKEIEKVPMPSIEWIDIATTYSESLEKEAIKYDEDAKGDNRPGMQNRLNSLQARKWLHEQRGAIEEEIKRLLLIEQIDEAKKMATTQVLSIRKGKLAETLITGAFVERFNKELENLGASKIRVELVKTGTRKGKVLHKLQLKGAPENKLPEILSEGENRIVSIASFLADVTGKSGNAPLVFDDPISSLDQDFEERVVQRLVEISKEKQVIVFTHRLSLLGLLQEYAEKHDKKSEVIYIRSEVWGTGEPQERPLFIEKPRASLNILINSRLPKARKIINEVGKEAYDLCAANLCRDFRMILERLIEHELMFNIVQRHRRDVQTKGKIKKLANISQEDCEIFDSMMTKYSRHLHSQSDEAPVMLPEVEELEKDLNEISKWLAGYKN